jgi:hypothetical protein
MRRSARSFAKDKTPHGGLLSSSVWTVRPVAKKMRASTKWENSITEDEFELDSRPGDAALIAPGSESAIILCPLRAKSGRLSLALPRKSRAKIIFAILVLLRRSLHLERYARLTLPAAKLACLRRRAELAFSNRSLPRDPDASGRLPCLAPRSAGARCIDQAQIRAPPGRNDFGRPQANEP